HWCRGRRLLHGRIVGGNAKSIATHESKRGVSPNLRRRDARLDRQPNAMIVRRVVTSDGEAKKGGVCIQNERYLDVAPDLTARAIARAEQSPFERELAAEWTAVDPSCAHELEAARWATCRRRIEVSQVDLVANGHQVCDLASGRALHERDDAILI